MQNEYITRTLLPQLNISKINGNKRDPGGFLGTIRGEESPINDPSRGPGVPSGCLRAPSIFPGDPTAISPDDVGCYCHRSGLPLSTVDFVSPSDCMYMGVSMGVSQIYGEYPTIMARPLQMFGKLATPLDPVLTPTLVTPHPHVVNMFNFSVPHNPIKKLYKPHGY